MARMYFDGWYNGYKASAEEWYENGLVYINIQYIRPGGRVNDPAWEKSFLLNVNYKEEIRNYAHSLVNALSMMDEKRNGNGQLIPLKCELPKPLFGGLYNV